MSMTLKEKIKDLKDTLQVEEDFGAIMQKFFDLSEYENFITKSKTKKNAILESMLSKLLEQLFQRPMEYELRLKYMKRFKFYHGSFMAEGGLPGTIIYFETIRMGMFVMPKDMSGNMEFIRFTADMFMSDAFTTNQPTETSH